MVETPANFGMLGKSTTVVSPNYTSLLTLRPGCSPTVGALFVAA